MGAPKLFSPGPIMVTPEVRNALLHYDICHRSKEFEAMFVDTQNKINKMYKADDSYYSVIVSGSGTSANETVLSSIVKPGEKVLLIRNGVFGERLQEIIDKYQIPYVDLPFAWATYPDVNVVKKALVDNPDAKIVAMVYHETSTGMLNPVHEVGQICKELGRKLYVDTVSAAAGELIDVVADNISFATSVGGKCLGAFPGSAYVIAKEDELKAIKPEHCKNVYLNLYKHYQIAKSSHQTPNTPNVTLFWALNVALTQLLDQTLEARNARYVECATIIRKGLAELGCTFLLSEHMSSTVTSVFLPKSVNNTEFIAEMEKRGYVFYAGKGDYQKQNMIQVANMGEIYPQDCYNMLRVFKECMQTIAK